MLKTTAVIIAVLLSSAAYADTNIFIGKGGGGGGGHDGAYPGAIERGNSTAWTPNADGVPIIMPFVSDRTAKKARPNFQRGPFHELGIEDRVEWRR